MTCARDDKPLVLVIRKHGDPQRPYRLDTWRATDQGGWEWHGLALEPRRRARSTVGEFRRHGWLVLLDLGVVL